MPAPHFQRDYRRACVRSPCISYTNNYNVVEVDFVDGTCPSDELFPMVKLKAELNDWNVENGKMPV